VDSSNKYRIECLKRHYQEMPDYKVKMLHSKFLKQSKKKAQIFAKRINKAKGWNMI